MTARDTLERVNELLDTYGLLLTEKQRTILNSRYQFDLSIGEIAMNENISRAAVEDTIKKATNKLEEYESKLCLISKKKELFKLTNEIEDTIIKEKIKELL